MNDRLDASGSWERAGLPPRLLRRGVAVAVVLAVVATASVFVVRGRGSGVGASRAPTPPSAPEPPSVRDDPSLSSERAYAARRAFWRAVPIGDRRIAVVYPIKGDQQMLAIVGPDRRAHPCHVGTRISLGDFVGDRVLFTEAGDLFAIGANCEQPPVLLAAARSVARGAEYPLIACPSFAPDGGHISPSARAAAPVCGVSTRTGMIGSHSARPPRADGSTRIMCLRSTGTSSNRTRSRSSLDVQLGSCGTRIDG